MGALKAVSSAKNILVVLSAEDVSGWKSLRNVPEVHLITAGQLNTYDVLVSDDVVFTKQALDEFVAAAGKRGSQDDAEPASAGRHAAIDADEPITLSKKPAAQDEDDTVAADEAATTGEDAK